MMAKTTVVRVKGDVAAGTLWMLVLSLLLFWLPFFGPLIALPAIVLGIVFFILGTATGIPLLGVVTGGAVFLVVAAAAVGPLLIGAVVGGAMA